MRGWHNVLCALFPADRQRALKCGLAQQGASICKGKMLNAKDEKDMR